MIPRFTQGSDGFEQKCEGEREKEKNKKDREIVKAWADTNGLFLSTVLPALRQYYRRKPRR
jgi:hypothetical protein